MFCRDVCVDMSVGGVSFCVQWRRPFIINRLRFLCINFTIAKITTEFEATVFVHQFCRWTLDNDVFISDLLDLLSIWLSILFSYK